MATYRKGKSVTKAELLLKALADKHPMEYGGIYWECTYCKVEIAWDEDLENTEYHKPDCAWRLAKEYLQERGA